ncbi:MAG: hypothetical protein HC850_01130 [Rhodomicrobium sp.]|nr:hypothetical protein [Rhodomicrobium sp.]
MQLLRDIGGTADASAEGPAASSTRADGGRGEAPAVPRRIAFFGHDAIESTVIKRARMFQTHGSKVVGFMFRRERTGRSRPADWDNIDLGVTVDRNYLARCPSSFPASPRLSGMAASCANATSSTRAISICCSSPCWPNF